VNRVQTTRTCKPGRLQTCSLYSPIPYNSLLDVGAARILRITFGYLSMRHQQLVAKCSKLGLWVKSGIVGCGSDVRVKSGKLCGR